MAICIQGVEVKFKRDLKIQQQIAYSTAILIGFATHNPKKMPSFEKAFSDDAPRAMTPDQIMMSMQAWTCRIPAA